MKRREKEHFRAFSVDEEATAMGPVRKKEEKRVSWNFSDKRKQSFDQTVGKKGFKNDHSRSSHGGWGTRRSKSNKIDNPEQIFR